MNREVLTQDSNPMGVLGSVTRGRTEVRPLIERVGMTVDNLKYSRAGQLCIDAIIVTMALRAAYMVRFDGQIPEVFKNQFWAVLPFALAVYLGSNCAVGVYKLVWRFVGLPDAALIAVSVGISAAIAITFRLIESGVLGGTVFPFGVLLSQAFFTYSGFLSARLARRVLFQYSRPQPRAEVRKRLLIVGAGEAGLYLLRELVDSGEFEVAGFLDDDTQLQGRTIAGWQVLGTTEALEAVVAKHAIDEVALSMPSAPKGSLDHIARRCTAIPVKVSSVPTLSEIMSGRANIAHLRPISMEDLLGRASIRCETDVDELGAVYMKKRILVTGAGGSIGSELVRQLKEFEPTELILLDKDENNLYEVACEIREGFAWVTDVVADIRDYGLMEKIFEIHRPDIVFHAAAYKHVPLMEHHPSEAILNNVIGTKNLVQISHAAGIERFVLISTDKAVNPTSTMGASKRVAEMVLQARAASDTATRFCCVRFGNVLGSRASVVPLFQRQIRSGRNITVTHPDVRRYFMTIPEAVQLVIQAGSLGRSGEIFLLDMGDPVKIVDLARKLIELSGFVPDKDVRIEFTGLRPGEKLDEELLNTGERGNRTTKFPKIFMVEALQQEPTKLHESIDALTAAAREGDRASIRRVLHGLDIGYHDAPDKSDGSWPAVQHGKGRSRRRRERPRLASMSAQ